MGKKFDVAVVTGEYQSGGQTKKRWMNIGVVMENDKGMYLLLDPVINLAAIPRGEGKDRVMASFFEPRDGQGGGQSSGGGGQRSAPPAGGDDEIPF